MYTERREKCHLCKCLKQELKRFIGKREGGDKQYGDRIWLCVNKNCSISVDLIKLREWHMA